VGSDSRRGPNSPPNTCINMYNVLAHVHVRLPSFKLGKLAIAK